MDVELWTARASGFFPSIAGTLIHTVDCAISQEFVLWFKPSLSVEALSCRQERSRSESPGSLPRVAQEKRTQAFKGGPRLVSLFYSIAHSLLARETLSFSKWVLHRAPLLFSLRALLLVHLSSTVLSPALYAFATAMTAEQRDGAF